VIPNVEIERFFFGQLDRQGLGGVEYFAGFVGEHFNGDAFNAFLRYMSIQKLRTPKGLAWLRQATRSLDRNFTLRQLQRLQNIFCATWTDCVWQIADASRSATKFIVSDHPVTVYNRECFPGAAICLSPNDPDVRQVGTHTLFPLSLDKVLILTNLAWVRNPYQDATKKGPNDKLFRHAVFNFLDIQTGRFLSEEEVREINYIIKRRALRYVAAAEEDWLFPEKHLRCDHWRKLGDGYLLMPDPHQVYMGGTTYIGYRGGGSQAFGPYGHRPWERAFEDVARDRVEAATLQRFQAEWSAMFGPAYRGVTHHFGGRDATKMPDEIYGHYLEKDREALKRPGERARRRRLRRE